MQHLKIEISPDNWRYVKDLESDGPKYSIYAYQCPQHNAEDLKWMSAQYPKFKFKLVTL